MIKLERISNGFNLFFNNYLFLHHTINNSILKIGIGYAKYKFRFGHFKIKGKVKSKMALTQYEIIEEDENLIKIEFYSTLGNVTLEIMEKNELLIIIPECSNSDINRFWISINADSEEAIFGCGEQFSEFNLRGKIVPLWSEEQGNCRGDPKWLTRLLNIVGIGGHWYNTYYPQPTFISSNKYFCHIDASAYSEFDFTKKSSHMFEIWEIPERITLGKYDSMLATVSSLSNLLGKQPELPEWAYNGVWLGIQGGKAVVEEKLKKCLEKGVKVAVIWCQDWQGKRMMFSSSRLFWNWIYDNELYPDLPAYIKTLNEKGIRFMGYINSFLAGDGVLFKEAEEKGYTIKNQDGDVYHVQTGMKPFTTMVDLSNPEAIEWLKDVVKKHMIDIGLSGWMADFGEYLPNNAVLDSGEDPTLFHNKYPMIWAETMYEAIKEAEKLGEIIFFTRSGYSYTSKYTTLAWAGDQLVGWSIDDGLASVIPAGLSLGVCGIGYYHSDTGGYSTFFKFKRTPELFKRWLDHSLFTMVIRTHEGNIPEQNIQFDDDSVIEHFAKTSKRHLHLKPYLKHLSDEYQKDGLPPMRPCFLHYENDPVLYNLKYQYLFGKDLLVAPVYKPNQKTWKLYLPEDNWIYIWTDKEYGKGWVEIEVPIGTPPVFYRKDSKFIELFSQLKNI